MGKTRACLQTKRENVIREGDQCSSRREVPWRVLGLGQGHFILGGWREEARVMDMDWKYR
jgi:hypothetical protein